VNLEEVKAHALELSEADQAELLQFLVARLRRNDPQHWMAESPRKIDEGWAEAQAGNYYTAEQVKVNLAPKQKAQNWF